ncbi:hypothetical protein CRUP_021108, partial [Coryphaenoides rupestris]
VMYGALVASLVIRSIFIVTWVYPRLRSLCYTSLGVFSLGFLLWNIDNLVCDSLRASRQTLPPGVGVVTQFHAWWHIFTGLGSYLHILLSFCAAFGPRWPSTLRRRAERRGAAARQHGGGFCGGGAATGRTTSTDPANDPAPPPPPPHLLGGRRPGIGTPQPDEQVRLSITGRGYFETRIGEVDSKSSTGRR